MVDRIRIVARWLTRLEFWVVAVLVAAAGLVSSRLLLPALVVAGAFWPVRWLAHGRPSVRTPGDWAVILMALMIPVTLWATPSPDVTRTQVYRLLLGIVFYYAVANWANSAVRLQWSAGSVMLVGVALALIAPFTVQLKYAESASSFLQAFQHRLLPILSDVINPNVMAGALVVLLPCALGVLVLGWKQLRWPVRACVGVAVLLMMVVLFLSESRGAIMALGIALIVLVSLSWRYGWLAAPVAVMASGLVAWQLGPDRVINALVVTQTFSGLDVRLEVWSRALYILQDFPFTGVGMGGFEHVANLLYPFFLLGPDADIPHAHNLFLQTALDLGLPGLVAWLALVLLVFAVSWNVYSQNRAAGDCWLAGFGAGLICSQVALVVHGLTDAATWGTRPAVLVWVVWGFSVAALRVSEKAQGGLDSAVVAP